MSERKFDTGLAVLLTATAVGLFLTVSQAFAQDGQYDESSYRGPETVIVTAPPPPYFHSPRTARGGDIVDVSLSRDVRIDDLDLSTPWGAHELRNRVRTTARLLCDNLDRRYPVTTDDSPPCYRTAVERGMEQADAAIESARSYARAE